MISKLSQLYHFESEKPVKRVMSLKATASSQANDFLITRDTSPAEIFPRLTHIACYRRIIKGGTQPYLLGLGDAVGFPRHQIMGLIIVDFSDLLIHQSLKDIIGSFQYLHDCGNSP